MAPVVFGLDLAEFKWSKFGSSYMWNTEYHLRRTKFIVYQCALIFCVISESLGTAVLSDYIDSERYVQTIAHNVYIFNNDYVGAASYNIFAGVYVAFIFGAAFFFDLIWPERKESKGVRTAWKVTGALAVVFHLSAALTLTVITARHCGYILGDVTRGMQLLSQFTKDGGTPLCYRHDGRAIAAVVFVWLGFVSVAGSCVLLYLGIDNVERGPGPKSAHARQRDTANGLEAGTADANLSSATSEKEHEMHPPAPAPSCAPQAPTTTGETGTAPVAESSVPEHTGAASAT